VLGDPGNLDSRAAMLLGAYYAGAAIEQSMLGATHACANPITARYATPHGIAIAVMLPHVVRWNETVVADRYGQLMSTAGVEAGRSPGDALAARLAERIRAARLPTSLEALGVAESDLPALAADAAGQWTGTFNPRPFDAAAALELYRSAFEA
jgi:alcohol dehydrogenase